METSELDQAVGLWLRLAQQQSARQFGQAFEGTGVGQVPFAILAAIAANPGCRQADLGPVLRIRQPNLVEPIEALIARGLVARRPDPRDRRAQTLALTAQGEAEVARLRERHARLLAGYRERLGEEAYDALISLLRRFVAEAGADP
jgi:DNA-binding MarR family transcriptional regulator